MARLAAVVREETARLRAENAEQAAELERVRADLAVLQRMVFGRSSERARPEPSADGGDAGEGRDLRGSGTGGKKRGPGARAERRDYSHLPRVEVAWDFGGGGYCCPCDTMSHEVSELVLRHEALFDRAGGKGPRRLAVAAAR